MKSLKSVQKQYDTLRRAVGLKKGAQPGDLTIAARKIMSVTPRKANAPKVTKESLLKNTARSAQIKALM